MHAVCNQRLNACGSEEIEQTKLFFCNKIIETIGKLVVLGLTTQYFSLHRAGGKK